MADFYRGVLIHLWQSTLLAAAVAVIVWRMRSMPARLRYALWLFASLKFLLPFNGFASLIGTVLRFRGSGRILWGNQAVPQVMTRVITPTDITFKVFTPDSASQGVLFMLTVLWLAWSTYYLVRGIRDGIHIHRLKTKATPVRDENLRSLVHEACRQFDVRKSVSVKVSDQTASLAVCGFFRPAILIPRRLLEQGDPRMLRPLLLHECVHIRRNDNLHTLVSWLTTILFPFYPPVWMISRELSLAREQACDDRVSAIVESREEYAKCLVQAVKLEHYYPRSVGGTTHATASNLKRRIENIMATTSPRVRLQHKLIVALVVVLGFSFVWASGERPNQEQTREGWLARMTDYYQGPSRPVGLTRDATALPIRASIRPDCPLDIESASIKFMPPGGDGGARRNINAVEINIRVRNVSHKMVTQFHTEMISLRDRVFVGFFKETKPLSPGEATEIVYRDARRQYAELKPDTLYLSIPRVSFSDQSRWESHPGR